MKRIFLAAFVIMTATTFSASTNANAATTAVLSSSDGKHIPASAVPAPVIAAFNAQFPTATNVQWEKEREHGQTTYQADFRLNGKRWRAEYTADGSLISSGPR